MSQRRRYLVDGYNLLHQFPELKKHIEGRLETAREGLLLRLSSFALGKGVEVTVVFDGSDGPPQPSGRWRGIEVHFSRPPQKADPQIKRMIADRKRNEEMVLVSSDRDIGSYARLCGVRVETSQAFAHAIQAQPSSDMDRKLDRPLSEREVDEWISLFKGGPTRPEETR